MSLLWRSHAGAPGRTRFGTGASQAADLGGAAYDQSSQNNSPSTPGSAGQSPPETAARKCGSCKRGGSHQLCYHHRWVKEGQAESRQGEGGGRGDRQKRQGVGGGGVDWLCRTEHTRQSLCLLKGLRKAAGGGGRSLRGELIAAHIPPSLLHLSGRFLHFTLQLCAHLPPVHSSVPPPVPCSPLAARAPHPSWHAFLGDLPMEPKEQVPRVPQTPG